VLANVLVAQAARVLGAEGERLPPTGPSFRDLTRVAGANTALWRDIYLANGDALVRAIDDAMERLGAVRALLAAGDGDGVAAWNDAAREDRRRLLEADLAGGEVHELRVQVPNRPGIVAQIALALGRASIDIVDMALYPTSGGATGTIALWLRAHEIAQAQSLVADLGLEAARA
jgi:prephenate dehydrogenase